MLYKIKSRFFRRLLRVLLVISFIIISIYTYLNVASRIEPPEVSDVNRVGALERQVIAENHYRIGENWLRKNEYGMWEMYVEGDPFERGVIIGKLSEELIQLQEEFFVAEIKKYIPSEFYMNFLRVTIAFFNRYLDENIPEEYLKEIYGISLFASQEFDAYGSPFYRILNYHAAHDLGHTLQNYNLVGCSSFSVWADKTADQSLLTGRNFDFYFGEGFARNKIILFINPSEGHKFAFVTWGGMIGAVSGMNEHGLTVTVNAARSEIPRSSATPIPIVAREILQYAKNIDEAVKIASSRKLFMSESFMVSSAADGKTVIIEKSPERMGLVQPDSNVIFCTNHYQSNTFRHDSINVLNMREGATSYRFKRLQQLVESHDSIDFRDVAAILRDRRGMNNIDIGNGNEKALNQLIAHHSVVFKPTEKLMWISTKPNVLGKYLAYNLDSVFTRQDSPKPADVLYEEYLTIQQDSFLSNPNGYDKFLEYKSLTDTLKRFAKSKTDLPDGFVEKYIATNKNNYEIYKELGEYFEAVKNYEKAVLYYEQGLKKEINSLPARWFLIEHKNKCLQKQSK
jgi:isopenicillin-N N-acyltransferase like protein